MNKIGTSMSIDSKIDWVELSAPEEIADRVGGLVGVAGF
jgi:hypothetical protein